jgi:8-oxo-dGTP pyrophosphatase MutT (NUDIX family)
MRSGACRADASSPASGPKRRSSSEIAEELGVEGANIGALLWVIENPFTHAGRRYRETGFYYQVAPPAGACPIVTGEFTGPEPHLRLRWFPLAKLAAVDLRPSVLRERLMACRIQPARQVDAFRLRAAATRDCMQLR